MVHLLVADLDSLSADVAFVNCILLPVEKGRLLRCLFSETFLSVKFVEGQQRRTQCYFLDCSCRPQSSLISTLGHVDFIRLN